MELSFILPHSETTIINISNANLQKEDQLQLNQDLEPKWLDPACTRYIIRNWYLFIYFFKKGHGNGNLRNTLSHIKLSYLRRPFGKGRFVIRHRSHTGPCILIWSTQDSSYKKKIYKYNHIHAHLEENSCIDFFYNCSHLLNYFTTSSTISFKIF